MKKVHSFELNAVPPYSFDLTVHKPAGWWWATPYEIYEADVLWTAMRIRENLIGLKLESLGAPMKPRIGCHVYSESEPREELKGEAQRSIRRALRTDEDLNPFYEMALKDDILRDVVQDLRGMRTQGWQDLFPALILAVTLQMAPMKRSNQMMDLLLRSFGDRINFEGREVTYWPSPSKIARTDEKDLWNVAKLGYRARNLKSIADELVGGFPTMEELSEMPYEEAKGRLMTLRGIGDYSADLVIGRMGIPLDVWSAKIFHVLFFSKVPESPRESIPELRRVATQRWGEWASHAFVYILNDLRRISQRIGFDLTKF